MSLMMLVEGGIGEKIDDLIAEMIVLANRVQIIVRAKINGVDTMVHPGDCPVKTFAQWNRALSLNIKFCSGCA